MNRKKTFLLTVLAATVVIALAAAGSASATVLCKAAESPCSAVNRYAKATALHGVTEAGWTMKTETQKAECVGYTFSGKTTTEGSATETVEGNHESIQGAPCSGNFFLLKAGGYVIHHLAGTSNGQLTIKNFEVLLTGNGIECKYGGTFTAGTLTGGNPATLTINASVPKTSGGFLCSPTMTMQTGQLGFTGPKPLYVAAS
ncbi:MAG: hypothetical protein M3335_05085 [Actinomycetota bacterium]|nr:hypothetical protein [Actinomycetota bacterium]